MFRRPAASPSLMSMQTSMVVPEKVFETLFFDPSMNWLIDRGRLSDTDILSVSFHAALITDMTFATSHIFNACTSQTRKKRDVQTNVCKSNLKVS
jgi:hypothetical protein